MPTNHAAILVAKKAKPLEITEVPYSSPGPNEVVVKNAALGINPVDAYVQNMDVPLEIQYPIILGTDTAGTIAEVGANVSRFKIGDRVLACAGGGDRGCTNKNGGFQEYSVVNANQTSPIPDSVSFEAACAVPVALCTVASGMYLEKHLGLPWPSLNPKPTGLTLLIWGAASSLGTQAIQIARASGIEVIATASPKNNDLLKKLGANEVFDYNSPTVVEDIVKAFKGKKCAGALPVAGSTPGIQACMDIVAQSEGKKYVAVTLLGTPDEKPEGVTAEFVWGTDLKHSELGDAIFKDYLPEAMAKGKFLPTPEPDVVGNGLGDLQKALDKRMQMQVSAQKIVVSL